ncbi:MAG TPA: penicillin-binding protein 2 [Phycisphaerae bacterium]|nr:penicillin-binding protein 2 [Phycisphaerae bacterium]HPS53397.1 penicillin-binding protein 2 [Phycisphaerae bacterium]
MNLGDKIRYCIIFIALLGGLAFVGIKQGLMIDAKLHPKTPQQADISQMVDDASQGQRIVMPLPARPGSIYATSRQAWTLAAASRQVPSCFVDPKYLREKYDEHDIRQLAQNIADILNSDPAAVYEIMTAQSQKRFVWIAREIEAVQADKIRELNNRALGISYEWRREYPNGPLAGSVIGFRCKDGSPGVGLEAYLDDIVKASDGKRIVLGDAGRRGIYTDIDATKLPQDGGNVFITIDLVIQDILQRVVSDTVSEYKAVWGTGIVLDPWTGEILAMCATPSFDPNTYNDTPIANMTNHAITSPYEPGSVFKPIIAAAAVNTGVINYQTKIFCENGVYHASKGGRISDHGNSYGYITVETGIIKSSNIMMAKIGEKLGNKKLFSLLHDWGFGQDTGIDLPQESPGIVRKLPKWDGYSTRRVPFGQEIGATSIQLAMAFASFANGGELMKPQIVGMVTDPRGKVLYKAKPKVVRRVLSQRVAKETLQALRLVVTEGTGKKAKSDFYTIWGKTGTAQVPGPHGYMEGAYTASFIGGAPFENPRVICLISIYRPDRYKGYYGGTVTAPAVKSVLEQTLEYLNVPHDLAPKADAIDEQARQNRLGDDMRD